MALLPRYNFVFNSFLEEILKQVDTCSLFKVRLVSHFWKNSVDTILLQRSDNVISFYYSPMRNNFICCNCKSESATVDQIQIQDAQKDESKDLDGFLRNFPDPLQRTVPPSKNFQFIGPKFRDDSLRRFFFIYSPHIKELTLDWDGQESFTSYLPPNTFTPKEVVWLTVISNGHLTQLDKFTLKNFWVFDPRNTETVENIKLNYPARTLPALKFVEIKTGQRESLFNELDKILPDLVAAAPNLQQVYFSKYFFGRNCREILLARPTLFRLECLIYRLFEEHEGYFGESRPLEILELTEKYCSPKKGIIYLDLKCFRPPRTPEIFQSTICYLMKILQRSQNSLEHLTLGTAALIFLMKVAKAGGIMEFRRVKYLSFGCMQQAIDPGVILNKYPLLFQGLLRDWEPSPPNFSILFPELEILELTSVTCPAFDNFFPLPTKILGKVRSLQVLVTESVQSMGKLLKLVPFTREVDLGNILDFPQIATSLWQLEYVETLNLSLRLINKTATPAHVYPQIDSAFTGLPVDILLVAKCLGDEILVGGALNELRKNPSVLNLPNLTNLVLTFSYAGRREEFERMFGGFLTNWSFKFGFSMMQNLSVTIKSDSEILDEQISLFSSYENVYARLTSDF